MSWKQKSADWSNVPREQMRFNAIKSRLNWNMWAEQENTWTSLTGCPKSPTWTRPALWEQLALEIKFVWLETLIQWWTISHLISIHRIYYSFCVLSHVFWWGFLLRMLFLGNADWDITFMNMRFIFFLMKDPIERLVVGTLFIFYVLCHEEGLVPCWFMLECLCSWSAWFKFVIWCFQCIIRIFQCVMRGAGAPEHFL